MQQAATGEVILAEVEIVAQILQRKMLHHFQLLPAILLKSIFGVLLEGLQFPMGILLHLT